MKNNLNEIIRERLKNRIFIKKLKKNKQKGA